MKRKFISILLSTTLCASCMWLSASVSFAAAGNVSITLPGFKVTLNGEVFNNNYSRFPLIVYKDVTYFPMTYNDCRFLGIESVWTGNTTGLFIDSTGVTAAFNPYLTSQRNGRGYTAQVPAFPISVNGRAVDNSKEEYPIISFRDITYFPMTWKYCVDQFGWDYKFDAASGLVITSANPKLKQIPIPKNRLPGNGWIYDDEGKKSSSVIAKNGFMYYTDDKGAVKQAPLTAPTGAKTVYQLEIWSYGDGTSFDSHNFYEENGKAYLFFHSGGAVMGSDHRYMLKEDGTTQKIQGSYWETTLLGDMLYMYWRGPTPGPGDLRVQDAKSVTTDDGFNPLGPADYWYYPLANIDGLPIFERIGDELFVRAANYLTNQGDDGGYTLEEAAVYKVNVKTNALTKVAGQANLNIINAQISGDYMYYVCAKEEGDDQASFSAYKHSLKDGTETLIGGYKGKGMWQFRFAALGDHVYYINDGGLYRFGEDINLNPKAEVLTISVTGDNREYLTCAFKETMDSKYRVMVFDKSGKIVFKTSDRGSNMVVEGKTLYFYNITTEALCETVI